MKVVSKVEIDENRFLVTLENGMIGYINKVFIQEKGKKKTETVNPIFLESSLLLPTVTTEELNGMSRPEALTQFGKHVRTEKGNIINLVKFYEGK